MSEEYRSRMRKRRGRREEVHVTTALNSSLSPLMRQIRKFTTMQRFLDVLPEEISGMAVPYDLRLWSGDAGSSDGEQALASKSTLFVYAAGATVEAILLQQKLELIEAVNAKLPYVMVEEMLTEQANAVKIQRQMNILAASPD